MPSTHSTLASSRKQRIPHPENCKAVHAHPMLQGLDWRKKDKWYNGQECDVKRVVFKDSRVCDVCKVELLYYHVQFEKFSAHTGMAPAGCGDAKGWLILEVEDLLTCGRAITEYFKKALDKAKRDLAERTEERDEALEDLDRLQDRRRCRPREPVDLPPPSLAEHAILVDENKDLRAELGDERKRRADLDAEWRAKYSCLEMENAQLREQVAELEKKCEKLEVEREEMREEIEALEFLLKKVGFSWSELRPHIAEVHKMIGREAAALKVRVDLANRKSRTTWMQIRQIQYDGVHCSPDCAKCLQIHKMGKGVDEEEEKPTDPQKAAEEKAKQAENGEEEEALKSNGGEGLDEAVVNKKSLDGKGVDEEEMPVEMQKAAEEKAKQEEGGEEEKQLEAKTGDPEGKAAESDGIAVIGEGSSAAFDQSQSRLVIDDQTRAESAILDDGPDMDDADLDQLDEAAVLGEK